MNKNNDINFKSLEASIYCHPFKEDIAIDTIIVDKFDCEKIKDKIQKSIPLLNYDKTYKPLILEIIDILDQNKNDFLVDQQKYISFYWNGMLIFRIIINKDVKHDKQLYISLQKYINEKEERLSDKNLAILTSIGIIGIITIGIVVGIMLFRSKVK